MESQFLHSVMSLPIRGETLHHCLSFHSIDVSQFCTSFFTFSYIPSLHFIAT
ncbi:hypothetical protein Hanom_Chr17g01571271 [Helianthus anomalus]